MSDVTHVWMYWENPPGRTRPAYLDLCQDTIRYHLGPSLEFHLVDDTSIFEWLPDLDPSIWSRLTVPAQRADYAWTRLVYAHGGLWLDADCIAVGPLDALVGYLGTHELASWGSDVKGRFFNNLFVARAGSPLLALWMQSQDETLASSDDWTSLSWSALGSDAFHPFMNDGNYTNIPFKKVAPVLWYEWRRFFSPFQSPADVLASSPVTVMLWNKGMGPILADRSVSELRKGNMLLSRLFRIALGESTLEEELDGYTRLSRVSDLRYGANGIRVERRLREWASTMKASSTRSANRSPLLSGRAGSGVIETRPGGAVGACPMMSSEN